MLEILNFIVGSTSTLLSAVAIYLYIVLWKKDKTDGSYDVFDATYKDVLSIAIENPELRNHTLTSHYKNAFKENDLVKYETYAFMSMNFCETIFDKGNEELMKTWRVVLEIEYKLHKEWLNDVSNKSKFKQEFLSQLEHIKSV
jgi:hypothetical protein